MYGRGAQFGVNQGYDQYGNPVSFNHGGRGNFRGRGRGRPPMTSGRGFQPNVVPENYGSWGAPQQSYQQGYAPQQNNGFASSPPQNNYASRPPQSNYSSRPPQSNYSSQPPQSNYASRPPQATRPPQQQ